MLHAVGDSIALCSRDHACLMNPHQNHAPPHSSDRSELGVTHRLRHWLGKWLAPQPSPEDVQVEATPPSSPTISLALQGGGAHGAYTWGVLDALLEHPDLQFHALSGSSAGAMNAVVFADGWLKGGREGARQGLAQFWGDIGKHMPWDFMSQRSGDSVGISPLGKALSRWASCFSPYQLNPFDLNPLRELLTSQIDFEGLRAHSPFKLRIGTTQANTGRLRLFREHELTVEVLLASACLPKVHHTIEIDGIPYWDGGFCANPPVFPLVLDNEINDLLIVLLNPLERHDVPRTLDEIEARMSELAFTAHLMGELRMLAQARACASAQPSSHGPWEQRLLDMRFHMIDPSHLETLHQSDTKLLAHGPFLEFLNQRGREEGQAWLAGCVGAVGHRSTVDLSTLVD